jgi:cobalt transporter subunit CbtA
VVRESVLTATVAGLIAALILTLAQSIWVTPLILQAETYEEAADHAAGAEHDHSHAASIATEDGHDRAASVATEHDHDHSGPVGAEQDHHHSGPGGGHGGDAGGPATHEHDGADVAGHEHRTTADPEHDHDAGGSPEHEHAAATEAGHHHDPNAWKPQDGWQRTLFTFASNLLMGVGYAFVLVALYLLWREPKSAIGGAVYGLAGFAVFFAAPALGLPPELPGTAAAELAARQQWWAMTAVATAVGLVLFASQPRWWLRLLAVAIIVAPQLVPAPHPAVESSLAPADLQSRFRLATALCNALFWLSLGLASGLLWRVPHRR